MKTITKKIIIHCSPKQVFDYMDDITHTGMHMTKSSGRMMGEKLELTQLSSNSTGLNATHQWIGNVLGLPINFTVRVTKWNEGKEKIWQSVGAVQMIILSWFQMHLIINDHNHATEVKLSITYERPRNLFYKFLSFFLADYYARWCVRSMLKDSKRHLESKVQESD